MSCFDVLSPDQARGAIDLCARRAIGLTVTVRRKNRWTTYRSRIVAQFGEFLWIAYPTLDDGASNEDFAVREQLGLTFRAGHQRHVFSVTVVGQEPYTLDDGVEQIALKVTFPEVMHRAERRIMDRVEIPASAAARARFWLGGRVGEPAEATVSAPVWFGRVMDMSTGGVCIRADVEAARYIDVGDLIGVRVTFGGDLSDGILMDATLRHAEKDGQMVLMGFQFVEGDFSPEIVKAFEAVGRKLDSFR